MWLRKPIPTHMGNCQSFVMRSRVKWGEHSNQAVHLLGTDREPWQLATDPRTAEQMATMETEVEIARLWFFREKCHGVREDVEVDAGL